MRPRLRPRGRAATSLRHRAVPCPVDGEVDSERCPACPLFVRYGEQRGSLVVHCRQVEARARQRVPLF